MFGMKQAKHIGCKYVCKVVDIDHVDIMNGVKMDQGPVLIVTFQSQQVIYVQNSKGDVVEGDAVSIWCFVNNYVWLSMLEGFLNSMF